MLHGPHVLMAGAGLGALHPGLAIAERLTHAAPLARVSFAGSGRPAERHTVRGAGYAYTTIPSKPTPRSPLEAIRFVTDNAAGYWAARWVLKEERVSLVVGLGGAVSAAAARAARSLGVPLVLLEQSAHPERATRVLGPSAEVVCLGFDQARARLPVNTPTLVTGTPGRGEFVRLCLNRAPRDGAPTTSQRPRQLIVMGGAVGSHSLNAHAPLALARLKGQLAGWRIVHQTGEGRLQETDRRYRAVGVEALVVSYIDRLASVVADSDLVVCRAGGATLAELALAGAPAVVVPLVGAAADRQMANARAVAQSGGCVVVDERAAAPLEAALANELSPLLVDDARRARMASAMRAGAAPQAAEHIAQLCARVLGEGLARAAA